MSEYSAKWAAAAGHVLYTQGAFGSGWLGQFYDLVELAQEQRQISSIDWPSWMFQGLHFVSAYLPVRYVAWMSGTGVRNPDTEATLGEIELAAEECLWSSLIDAPKDGLTTCEADLVRLVLSAESPARALLAGENVAGGWEQRYRGIVHQLSVDWKGRQRLSKWPCLALHFAGFILDFTQTRDLAGLGINLPYLDAGEDLARRLAGRMDQSALRSVAIWVGASGAPRDRSGLPMVGRLRGSGSRLSIRTITEALILAGTSAT